jgi:DNA/RNA endonuclease YhcR with UshA esterase domain
MKTKTIVALFAAAIAALAIAETPPTYPPEEARKHVGETATIRGMVDGFHQSGKGNIFLNMGGKYPNQAFTAFIPSGSAAQFPNAQQYEGRTVAVTGKIQSYKGKPEIVVTSPAQISAQE